MGNASGLKAWQVLANVEWAVAIELLQVYLLVHDDWMDDGGRPIADPRLACAPR